MPSRSKVDSSLSGISTHYGKSLSLFLWVFFFNFWSSDIFMQNHMSIGLWGYCFWYIF
jgi:hypothetical protein